MRKYTKMTIKEIRDSEETSLQAAKHKHDWSVLLDRIDYSLDFYELREVVRDCMVKISGVH
jgi:hypothetical protein